MGYRLFPVVDGPATAIPHSGDFISGVIFQVTSGGMWFEGYWWWVAPTGQGTAAQKFALWSVTGDATGGVGGVLVPGTIVTSGALTAGEWNWVPLEAPVQIAIGTAYVAETGVNGSFPDTNDSFGRYDPYAAGIVNGPLSAYSAQDGSAPAPYGVGQGTFTAVGGDPATTLAIGSDGSDDNFWMDVQVSGAVPAGYRGSYRLWPNNVAANPATDADSPVSYVVATEVRVTRPCALNAIWYYSPPGTAQLATECGIWSVGTGELVLGNASPNWSGPPGSGWVSCSFTGTTLSADDYRVGVYNGVPNPDLWSAKDALTDYWGAMGVAANGISTGPLFAPGLAAASPAYEYDGNAGGSSPQWTNGSKEPGQATFAIGPPNQYPYLYVDGLAQNYWVDLEVTPRYGSEGTMLAFFP